MKWTLSVQKVNWTRSGKY